MVDFACRYRGCPRATDQSASGPGKSLDAAATAYPPGVGVGESRACRYVLRGGRTGLPGAGRRGFRRTSAAPHPGRGDRRRRRRFHRRRGVPRRGADSARRPARRRASPQPDPGRCAEPSRVDKAEELKRRARRGSTSPQLKPGLERIAHNIDRLMSGPARRPGASGRRRIDGARHRRDHLSIPGPPGRRIPARPARDAVRHRAVLSQLRRPPAVHHALQTKADGRCPATVPVPRVPARSSRDSSSAATRSSIACNRSRPRTWPPPVRVTSRLRGCRNCSSRYRRATRSSG